MFYCSQPSYPSGILAGGSEGLYQACSKARSCTFSKGGNLQDSIVYQLLRMYLRGIPVSLIAGSIKPPKPRALK